MATLDRTRLHSLRLLVLRPPSVLYMAKASEGVKWGGSVLILKNAERREGDLINMKQFEGRKKAVQSSSLFHLSIFERKEDAADKSDPLFSSSSIAVSKDGALATTPEGISSLAGTLRRRTASTELSSSELLLICLLKNGLRSGTSLSFSTQPGCMKPGRVNCGFPHVMEIVSHSLSAKTYPRSIVLTEFSARRGARSGTPLPLAHLTLVRSAARRGTH